MTEKEMNTMKNKWRIWRLVELTEQVES